MEENNVEVSDAENRVTIRFTPTIPHCRLLGNYHNTCTINASWPLIVGLVIVISFYTSYYMSFWLSGFLALQHGDSDWSLNKSAVVKSFTGKV